MRYTCTLCACSLLITSTGHIKLTDFGLSKIGLMNRTRSCRLSSLLFSSLLSSLRNPQHTSEYTRLTDVEYCTPTWPALFAAAYLLLQSSTPLEQTTCTWFLELTNLSWPGF